jgi:DNA polymerase-4
MNSGHRIIFHMDMDAFYASIEQRDNPALRGKPVVVGGQPQRRGVVSAASYEARKYGVRSAMAMATAVRLCAEAVVIPPRMEYYRTVSQAIRAIFLRYTPLIEPVALDESFLDMSALVTPGDFAQARTLAMEIKRCIREETELTASAGVAPNKFLAKIASDLEKPDGLVVVEPAAVHHFLQDLPVSKIWGVGKVTERKLQALQITTIGALAQVPLTTLERHFGKIGRTFYALARGEDERPVLPTRETKSISREETFPVDQGDVQAIKRALWKQAQQVEKDLQRQGLKASTVTLKLRYADFTQLTRSHTSSTPLCKRIDIYRQGIVLLQKTAVPEKKVRLIGIGVSNFCTENDPYQLPLFSPEAFRLKSLPR